MAVKAFEDGPLIGRELRYLHKHMPYVDTLVAAIFRQDKPLIPEGGTVIKAGDEVFFIAATENICTVLKEWRYIDKPGPMKDSTLTRALPKLQAIYDWYISVLPWPASFR
jgi:NhaP-type Na+/H+ and K+/H+ antiporter